MIDPEEVKAIERAEQNLAYSRMTRRDELDVCVAALALGKKENADG